ncbi:hypothetical protein AAAT63_11350, partial [Dorea ammoniilytica]
SVTAIRIPQLRCSMLISVDFFFCTLRVKADRFALCHGNSHSATTLLHAHFRENRKRLDTLVCKHPGI